MKLHRLGTEVVIKLSMGEARELRGRLRMADGSTTLATATFDEKLDLALEQLGVKKPAPPPSDAPEQP